MTRWCGHCAKPTGRMELFVRSRRSFDHAHDAVIRENVIVPALQPDKRPRRDECQNVINFKYFKEYGNTVFAVTHTARRRYLDKAPDETAGEDP